MKLSFEIVQANVFRLLNAAAIASTIDAIYFFYDSYVSYLESCGWTEHEFTAEMLKRIDSAWLPQYN